jgi:cation transport ATPase
MKRILMTLALSMLVSLRVVADSDSIIEMEVHGMVCAFCAQGISKKLGNIEAVDDLFVNLNHGLVAIALKPGQDIPDNVLRSAIIDVGYSVNNIDRRVGTLTELRAQIGREP